MSKTKAWISAMRLRTLPLSFSVIIVGNAIAYSGFNASHSLYRKFDWAIFALTLLTTLFLQILSNFANDYGDAKKGTDNENRIGPERAIQSGAISLSEMKIGIIVSSILSFFSGIGLLLVAFRGNIDWIFLAFILLGLAAIGAAIKYTVGKKAYGYSGLGDLFVFLFFGIVGVAGSYYLQSKSFQLPILAAATIMGAFCVAVLNLNNMRDIENDQVMGKNTLVVLLGSAKAKLYHYTLFAIIWIPQIVLFISYPYFPKTRWYVLFFTPVLIIHLVHLIKVKQTKDPRNFNPELKKIALSSLLYAIILFIICYLNLPS